MKVAVMTLGSRGDHVPFLALAQAFLRAGHEVRMAGDSTYTPLAEHCGVPYQGLDCDPGPEVSDIVVALDTAKTPADQHQIIMDRLGLPVLRRTWSDAQALAGWADVVVSHTSAHTAWMAAEVQRRPYVAGLLTPPEYPSGAAPGFPWLGPLNPLLWERVFRNGPSARVILAGMNQVRREFGVPQLASIFKQGFMPPTFSYANERLNPQGDLLPAVGSPELNLIAVSPQVAPPANRPAHHRVTGYWFLDDDAAYTPAPELDAFLQSGPKPVVITFATVMEVVRSMPGLEDIMKLLRAQTTEMVLQAVERAGVRAIVHDSWFGTEDTVMPDTILSVGNVPYDWLLPRVAGVAHHAGAGTSAATLRAGIPSATFPDVWDQLFWATRFHTLGVGTEPVLKRHMTADNLADRLAALVGNQALIERARELGAAVRMERGTDNAVRTVEQVYGKAPSPARPLR